MLRERVLYQGSDIHATSYKCMLFNLNNLWFLSFSYFNQIIRIKIYLECNLLQFRHFSDKIGSSQKNVFVQCHTNRTSLISCLTVSSLLND